MIYENWAGISSPKNLHSISKITEMISCIWVSHSGSCEEFCLLGYKSCSTVKIKPTSRRNTSPPSSGSKNKPSKKQVTLTCRVVYMLSVPCGRRTVWTNLIRIHDRIAAGSLPLCSRAVSLHDSTMPSTECVNTLIKTHESICAESLSLSWGCSTVDWKCEISIRIQEGIFVAPCHRLEECRVGHCECCLNKNPLMNSCSVVLCICLYRIVHWGCGHNQNPRINVCRVVSLHVGTVSSTEECVINQNSRMNSRNVGTVSSTESVNPIIIQCNVANWELNDVSREHIASNQFNGTTSRYIPDVITLNNYRYENLKCNIYCILSYAVNYNTYVVINGIW
jgi:hypothetical protein